MRMSYALESDALLRRQSLDSFILPVSMLLDAFCLSITSSAVSTPCRLLSGRKP
jgi:hypothetical protein